MNVSWQFDPLFDPRLGRMLRSSLVLGATSLTLCLAGAWWNPTQFFRSYLMAFVFWITIPLGCMAIVMLHHLTGGSWGVGIRPILEAASRTLAVTALLFVPILFGLSRLYLWAQPVQQALDPLLQYKRPYLNEPFFLARTVFYFAAWIGSASVLSKKPPQHAFADEGGWEHHLEALSGPGLVLYGLTVTFASVDWVMAIEPRWYSTIYGLLFVVLQVLAGLAFALVATYVLARTSPPVDAVPFLPLNDLGNLLLTFVMLWAYLAFCQFLIVWSGNLRDEIPWYTRRTTGGWEVLAVFLIVFHFVVPFLLLLSRDVKRRIGALSLIATSLIALTLLDIFWLVVPGFEPNAPHVHWMDLAAVIGIGGLWIAAFLSQLKGRRFVTV